MATQYLEEFKKDAVRYWEEHQESGVNACAKNLGISKSALFTWRKKYQMNEGNIPTRGRGNYESDEAKENARMRRVFILIKKFFIFYNFCVKKVFISNYSATHKMRGFLTCFLSKI